MSNCDSESVERREYTGRAREAMRMGKSSSLCGDGLARQSIVRIVQRFTLPLEKIREWSEVMQSVAQGTSGTQSADRLSGMHGR